MRTYSECVPCFLRQARDAAKLANVDQNTQEKILDEVIRVLPGFSRELSPPEIAKTIYRIVEAQAGGKDVYRKVKQNT